MGGGLAPTMAGSWGPPDARASTYAKVTGAVRLGALAPEW